MDNETDNEIDIRRIYYLVVRQWWLMVLLAILGGGIAFQIVVFTKPMYQADTTLYIINRDKVLTTGKTLDSEDIYFSQQLVQQYSEIISSRSVTTAVLRDIKNYNISEKEIISMVKIVSKKDSNILTLRATASDPEVAAIVANAAGREFTSQIRQLTNSDNVGVLDDAIVPKYPVANNGMIKVLIGVLAGLFVSFGIILSIDCFDTKVRSAEDIENGLKLRVIGIIPEHDIR